ncbi:MAG: tRNA uridine-5-carboxymethylaminomethyl(34) synthesis GTPase MnmE [Clostridia bacterium]|nr:tRNA uridine-5-carboxymethylaminomethyl(34) synthesis GTPase MnmE [Clostridia bacterium]
MYDIIVASATPPISGAIAIIRISGPGSIPLADKIFHPFCQKPLSTLRPRTAWYGEIRDSRGATLDRCLALTFPAPASYTGEDCAELQIHGGLTLVNRVLELCCEAGARMAAPGEFTKRAFLNGKLDLTGAEAVADLISAESAEGVKNAAAQLSGALRSVLEAVTSELLDLTSHFAAYIDYTEEGVEPPDLSDAEGQLRNIAQKLAGLSDSFSSGRYFGEGVRAAIVGKPNAGKSSLLNALTGTDRAIVTNIPGTTRDTIEATVSVNGALLRLVDTAGIRSTEDLAEKLGVQRSVEAARSAAIVIAVYDGSEPESPEDDETRKLASDTGAELIEVICKSDLPQKRPVPENALVLSNVTGDGIDRLKAELSRRLGLGSVSPDGSLVTNRRQADALRRAADFALRAADTLACGLTPDIAWVDTEAALSAVGEVTGRSVSEDILDRIFQRFCVGK